MPVAIKTPASPIPTPAAATGATAATPANSGGAINFLALIANMNALAAAVLPSQAQGADVEASSEVAELLEPATTDADKDGEGSTTEDEELLAALAFTGLPLQAPQTQQVQLSSANQEADNASDDAILDTLKGDSGGAPKADDAKRFAADLTARLASAQDLLPIAPPTNAADSLLKAANPETNGTASTNSTVVAPTTNHVPGHLQTLATHVQTAAPDSPPRELHSQVGSHAWTRELGDELAWMMQQGKDSASLKLSPEHLGPLEVRISMREGEASVWFGAAHADTRSALDQSLPRLRELFAAQGMVLADAGVFKEAPRQQPRAAAPNNGLSGSLEAGERPAATKISRASLRLIDTYA